MKRMLCLLLAAWLCLSAAAEPVPSGGSLAPLGACPALAVTGEMVWQIVDGQVLCQLPDAGDAAARIDVGSLYDPAEALVYRTLTSWSANSVLLLLGLTGADGTPRAALFELAFDGRVIAVRHSWDTTASLGFLFADVTEWIEVDVITVGQRLFIAAMDTGYRFHFHLCTPGSDALTPLGGLPLDAFQAAVPFGNDVLLIGPDPHQDDSLLTLTALSLTDGATRILRTVAVDSARQLFNFACDEGENRLYFTENSAVYALNLTDSEEPEAVGALEAMPAQLRLGAVTRDRYITHAETPGLLLDCNPRGRLEAVSLRVLSLPGEDAVYAATRDFGIIHPGYTAVVVEAENEAEALEALFNRTTDFDACVLRLNSDAWQALRASGHLANLSDCAPLTDAIADMSPRLQGALTLEGAPVACPVSVFSACQLLNVAALELLAGRSRAALPTDWAGFFALLKALGDQGALIDNAKCRLYDGTLPADAVRETLFSWMLQDCFLWLDAGKGRIDDLPEALAPVLDAFSAVPWDRLGLPETESDAPSDPAADALILDGAPEIAVMVQTPGCEFWPLSLRPEGPRLIAQNISVICVNPESPHPDGAIAFVEHLWAGLDPVTKAALCQSMDAPVSNPDYDADLAYLRQSADQLRQAADAARDTPEAAQLNGELTDLEAYIADYRENARLLISEESATQYRALAEQMLPTASDAWFTEPVARAMFDFLDGQLTAQAFARALADALYNPN